MLFNSIEFAIFFGAVFSAYWLSQYNFRVQNVLLIVASYIFYGWWDARFLVLIAISTVTDYIAGLGAGGKRITTADGLKCCALLFFLATILLFLDVKYSELICGAIAAYIVFCAIITRALDRIAKERRRKAFLIFSVVVNLGILGFFKYFNFFAESFQDAVSVFGWEPGFVTLNIVLPVGISFYTFQTMSYTLDIYRGRIRPLRQLIELTAFVSFFPQLVAGPIEKAHNLVPQFMVPRKFSLENLTSAAILFFWGLYKKIVIADNLAPIAESAFSNPADQTAGTLAVGVLAFSFQIYCDFSGYSDMARGTARALGFNLMLNFNLPYFARTPSEFWQRWHISLSTWLRDYLYISLGGNRHGLLITYRNLLLTMLLGGLWHGAAWTFIAWGFFHGAILVIYRHFRVDERLAAVPVSRISGFILHSGAMIFMFLLINVGWILFRAPTIDQAYQIFIGLFDLNIAEGQWKNLMYYVFPLVCVQIYQKLQNETEIFYMMPLFIRFNAALFVVFSVLFLSSNSGQEFIYFDF